MKLRVINGYLLVLIFFKTYLLNPNEDKNDESAVGGSNKVHILIPDIESVRSDYGSEYLSTIFKGHLKQSNIKQNLPAAGKPSPNGAIERLNQTLKWLSQKNIY